MRAAVQQVDCDIEQAAATLITSHALECANETYTIFRSIFSISYVELNFSVCVRFIIRFLIFQ